MESVLFTILTRAPISDIIGNGCYPNERPQASNLPCITYNQASGNPDYAQSGRTGLIEARYQINCWGKSTDSKSGYLIAKELAKAVKDLVSPIDVVFRETIGNIDVQGFFIAQEIDYRADGASNVGKFPRVLLDVTIWFRET